MSEHKRWKKIDKFTIGYFGTNPDHANFTLYVRQGCIGVEGGLFIPLDHKDVEMFGRILTHFGETGELRLPEEGEEVDE